MLRNQLLMVLGFIVGCAVAILAGRYFNAPSVGIWAGCVGTAAATLIRMIQELRKKKGL